MKRHITRLLWATAIAGVPVPAGAQSQAALTPPSAAVSSATTGIVDFGVRASSITGDAARYERYRDLGDGAFIDLFHWARERGGWLFDASANHVARRDQRYGFGATRPGKLKGWFQYDQIPMLLSNSTRTLFEDGLASVLTIPDAFQGQVQATPSSMPALFSQSARTFETASRRKITDGGFEYLATQELTFNGHVRYTAKSGVIPYGGSFGHSSLVELPAPVDHTLADVDAGAEYARNPVLLRVGYRGSWFNNENTALTFDNPFRATDSASVPSRGRLSLPPSNSSIGVNAMASVKMPRHSRATAYFSIGTLRDAGDPIMPQTINTAVTTLPIERTTVDGEARTSSMNLSFISRPIQRLDFSARFRTYEYDNRTPEFAMTQRVSYDNAASVVSPAVHTEPFGVSRGMFDADLRYSLAQRVTAGIGFSRIGEERTHRIFEETTDNTMRVTFDVIGQGWLTVRSKYEHAARRGTGIEAGEAELASIGEQPGMRHFDIASRDRNRVTVLASLIPSGSWLVTGSIAAGKDDYIESLFGLRDNTHRVYSAGVDYVPGDHMAFSGSYSFERYNALSRSRQANPGAQFTDASRNWATDATDRVHSFIATADFTGLGKVDLRFNYDFSRARALYHYITGAVADRTLPEEVVLDTTLPTPTQLPPTLSELHMATADATYQLTPRVGLGVSLWHERYRVQDFTLDIDANPDLARGQALLIGYLYRPYTATTFWVRMVYRW